MSNFVFQPPKGLGWKVTRRPKWGTSVQDSVSKRAQLRIAKQSYPIWEYEMIWNYLKGGAQNAVATTNAFQALMGFYDAMRGGYDSFLYSDPNDNSVSVMPFGTGDGATTTFQLTRNIGSGVDIVQNLDQSSAPTQLFRYDYAGLKNMIRNSSQVGGLNWGAVYAAFGSGLTFPGPIVTVNAAFAPDGSCNASKLSFPFFPISTDAAEVYQSWNHPFYSLPVGGRTFTFSVWLRVDAAPGGNGKMNLNIGDNISDSAGVVVTPTTEWKRYSVTWTAGGGNANVSMVAVLSTDTLNNLSTVYAWGAQFEENTVPTTYTSTGSIFGGPTALYSFARTNKLIWTQQFNNGAWGKNAGSITGVQTIVAPDGTTTADAFTANGGASDGYVYQPLASPASFSSADYIFSIWMKVPSGTLPLRIYITDDNGGGGQNSSFLYTLTTRWQRIIIQRSMRASLISASVQIGGANAITNGQVVHLWGAQLEAVAPVRAVYGQSQLPFSPLTGYATNYIVNTSTTPPVTDYTISSTGLVAFPAAIPANAIIAWSGSYYQRLRFAEDILDFEEFMYQLHTLKKVTFESLIL